MAIETHIEQLEAKHRQLETELGEMQNQPSASDVDIADMKRQKLHLKDRISQLQSNTLH